MGLGRVHQLGRRIADVAAEDDQRRPCVLGLGPQQRALEGVEVVGHLADVLDRPAVGGEALAHVVGVGELGGPVDGDVVVVVDGDQAAELEVAGQRRGLVGDPFLEAAVTGDDEGVVIADLGGEVGPEPALGDAHAHPVGHALAERAGGDLDPGGVVVLGMAGRAAAPLAELAQVVECQPVAGEVEHRVEEDRGVPVGEDEAVAVGPLGVRRVVVHDPGEQHMGQWGQRHGRARVARVGGPGGIHGQAPDDVDPELVEIAVAGRVGELDGAFTH